MLRRAATGFTSCPEQAAFRAFRTRTRVIWHVRAQLDAFVAALPSAPLLGVPTPRAQWLVDDGDNDNRQRRRLHLPRFDDQLFAVRVSFPPSSSADLATGFSVPGLTSSSASTSASTRANNHSSDPSVSSRNQDTSEQHKPQRDDASCSHVPTAAAAAFDCEQGDVASPAPAPSPSLDALPLPPPPAASPWPLPPPLPSPSPSSSPAASLESAAVASATCGVHTSSREAAPGLEGDSDGSDGKRDAASTTTAVDADPVESMHESGRTSASARSADKRETPELLTVDAILETYTRDEMRLELEWAKQALRERRQVRVAALLLWTYPSMGLCRCCSTTVLAASHSDACMGDVCMAMTAATCARLTTLLDTAVPSAPSASNSQRLKSGDLDTYARASAATQRQCLSLTRTHVHSVHSCAAVAVRILCLTRGSSRVRSPVSCLLSLTHRVHCYSQPLPLSQCLGLRTGARARGRSS